MSRQHLEGCIPSRVMSPWLSSSLGALTHMALAVNISTLMDGVVRPLLNSESRELDSKITRRAEKDVAQGVVGSGFALFARIRVYYDHYKDLADAVWSGMLRVLNDADVEPYPELTADLKQKFDSYLSAAADRTRSSMVAFSHMGHAMPKETFDGVYEEVRVKHHSEIDLYCHRVIAEWRRRAEKLMATNVTYNLSGNNPRVNINSQDYSLNVTNAGVIFRQLSDAISTGIPDEGLRDGLLRKTQDMESAVADKPRFLKLYSEFVALAANHMTVIGPFIPALTQLLGR